MTPLALLHGWGFPATVFRDLGDDLARDHAVRLLQLPGYAGEAFVALDLDALADQCAAELVDGTVLVAWSLGALVALRLAQLYPARVSRLVLLAATPCFVARPGWPSGMPPPVFAAFRERLRLDAADAVTYFARLNLGQRPDRVTRDRLASLAGQVDTAALDNGLDLLGDSDLRAAIPGLESPVTVIHARDDRLVPCAAGAWLAATAPRGRSRILPGGGHAFFLAHHAAVADEVRAGDEA